MALKTDLQKELGSGEFEYGNHLIEVEVRLEENYGKYYRIVQVTGRRGERDEVEHKSATRLDPDPVSAVPSRVSRLLFWSVGAATVATLVAMMMDLQQGVVGGLFGLVITGFAIALGVERYYSKEKPPVVGLESQLEQAVGKVFDKLDEFYEYTSEDYDIDIDVSIDKVKHEISWIEIEDDLDRILAEVDGLA